MQNIARYFAFTVLAAACFTACSSDSSQQNSQDNANTAVAQPTTQPEPLLVPPHMEGEVDYFDLLENMKFEELEQALAENSPAIWNREVYEGNAEMTLMHSVITPALLPQLNAWCENFPNSSHPFATRGLFYLGHAWHARGTGWGYTVTDEGARLFHARLLFAKADLEKAHLLNPDDPYAPTGLITVARGLGLSQELAEAYFQAAIKADPTCYLAYSSKLNNLMAKWGGSDEQMMSFARECMNNPPENSRVITLIILAHLEMAAKASRQNQVLVEVLGQVQAQTQVVDWWKQPEVWEDVNYVYRKRLEANPDSIRDHNALAKYSMLCGKYEVAREQFEIIGPYWWALVWDNDVHTFLEFRTEAFHPGAGQDIFRQEKAWLHNAFLAEMEKDPQNYWWPYNLGHLKLRSKQWKEAQEYFTKAFALNPGKNDALFQIGTLYYNVHQQIDKALEYFQQALKADPNDYLARYNAGLALYHFKRYEEALAHYKICMEVGPEYLPIWQQTSYCHYSLKITKRQTILPPEGWN